MNKCTVLIEYWQIQCCGDRFKIGESVKWRVGLCGEILEDYREAGTIDYYYENHPKKTPGRYHALTGIVTDINVLFTRFIPDRNKDHVGSKRSSSYFKPVKEAALWVKDENKHNFFDIYRIYREGYRMTDRLDLSSGDTEVFLRVNGLGNGQYFSIPFNRAEIKAIKQYLDLTIPRIESQWDDNTENYT